MRQYKTPERVRRNAAKRRERIRADPVKHEAAKAYARKYGRETRVAQRVKDRARYKIKSEKTRLKRIGLPSEHVEAVRTCTCCEICGGPPVGRWKKFTIDHDHTTGLFRGMLCSNCNVALGLFKDSTATLNNAIHYLKKSKDKTMAKMNISFEDRDDGKTVAMTNGVEAAEGETTSWAVIIGLAIKHLWKTGEIQNFAQENRDMLMKGAIHEAEQLARSRDALENGA